MKKRPNRQRGPMLKEGAVYALPLNDGSFAFGQVCCGGDFAVFDLKSQKPISAEEVIKSEVAFRVPVARDAAKEGGWKRIGDAPLRGKLAERAKYRHQPVGSAQVFVYSNGVSTPADPEEVQGLETLATWFSMHVEQRIQDHFAGRPNAFVESLQQQRD